MKKLYFLCVHFPVAQFYNIRLNFDKTDLAECYPEMADCKKWNTAQRKAKIIEFYCKKYDLVEFYDDEIDNLNEALNLGFDNLVLWKVEKDDTISLFDENYREV